MNNAATTATPAVVAEILDEIVAFVKRFVIFQDPDHYRLVALWVFHTHAFDAAVATPYLYVKSAEPQCGKTRLLETVELLVRNPKKTANMSAGALYAAIESQRPTIMLDEIDAIFTGGKANEDLRNMLNSGYIASGSVERQTMGAGGVRETETYSTFAPKALAGIDNGAIPATIADRCMVFDLKRKKKDETAERLNLRIVTPQAEDLKTRIHAVAMASLEKLAAQNPADIETISDRQFDIAEPLLQIAMIAKGWTKPTREAVERVFAQRKPAETLTVKALRTIKALFEEGDRDRVSSAEFAAAMDMTQAKASRLFHNYGINSKTIKFPGVNAAKGFSREDFTDAFERYL